MRSKSEAVIKALLAAYPDAAKAKDEFGRLPLHYAAINSKSEAVIKALLDAYPDAIKEKDNVRCGRGRRVLCPLLSHSSHMRSIPSPPPLFSLAAVQFGDLPKDLACRDAIKALLAV